MTKFSKVERDAIPEQRKTSKYQDLLDEAKNLSNNEALEVVEQKDVSITAVMSLMRKEGYKVTLRTVDGKQTLYVANKVEEAEATEEAETEETPTDAE